MNSQLFTWSAKRIGLYEAKLLPWTFKEGKVSIKDTIKSFDIWDSYFVACACTQSMHLSKLPKLHPKDKSSFLRRLNISAVSSLSSQLSNYQSLKHSMVLLFIELFYLSFFDLIQDGCQWKCSNLANYWARQMFFT